MSIADKLRKALNSGDPVDKELLVNVLNTLDATADYLRAATRWTEEPLYLRQFASQVLAVLISDMSYSESTQL